MCYSKKDGTYDLYGSYGTAWQYVINKISKVCKNYNFKYIRTPIFEDTDLYHNLIGKNTDVVSKELYNFIDRNNDNISLRPEGTTGVIRSYLENELYKKNTVEKFYYYGSMFRHEKIENGRYREFQQFGVEMFNNNSIYSSVEIISLALKIFNNFGLDVNLYINNLGSYEDRNRYETELKKYFKPHLDNLCDDCKRRYKENPIRILDCKVDKRTDIVLNAPKIDKYINKESKEDFDKVLNMFDQLGIKYVVNRNLVRGLNYYTDTVFEIKTDIDGLGSANTICGGGCYNNIVRTENNEAIKSIGFAIGLERLIDILYKKKLLKNIDRVIDYNILFDDVKLCLKLRNMGYISEINYNDISKYVIEKNNDFYFIKDYDGQILFDNLNYDELIKKLAS